MKRDLLTAAAVNVPEGHIQETPVMAVFREWNALYRHLNSEGTQLPDGTFNAEHKRLYEMEDFVLTLPSETIADFAAKVLMLTENGDHELPGPDFKHTAAFWAEARALVGEV